VGKRVFQGFVADRAEFLANEVRLATHGWTSHESFFFRRRRNRS
jgi:hypothetical protein